MYTSMRTERRRKLRLSRNHDDDYVEVTDGLSADDLVVSTWSNNLYEGADIQLAGSSESAGGQNAPTGNDNSAAGSSAAQEG